MITISVKNLVGAIREADAFKLPNMNEGTSYLYDTVYRRMSIGQDVSLSDIDFDVFEPEDIDSLNELHADVFERNHYAANGIASALRAVAPTNRAVAYV